MTIGDYFYEIPNSLPRLDLFSPYFIGFVFLCFLLSRIFRAKLRPIILLIASFVFLYSFSLYYLTALCALGMVGYLLSLVMIYKRNKLTLTISIVTCLLVLCFFKYQNYFNIKVLVPLGLSYVTFKLISYYADLYRGETSGTKNIIYFLNYVLFFPVITAGPINRFEHFRQVISNPQEMDYKSVKNGGFQFLLGIFEKRVFCDFLADISSRILSSALGGMNTLLAVVLYSFVIYLDFDSCSNIAIGVSRLLGFSIPKNFATPYLASSIKEFWNRWHISLGTWFRDYVYIPLGGNRKGKVKQYLYIMIVFILSGLWHGSTPNYLIWGFLHGVFRVLEEIVLSPFGHANKRCKTIVKPFGIIINFALVTFLWLFFRYSDINQIINTLQSIATWEPLSLVQVGLTLNEEYWLCAVLIFVIVTDIIRKHLDVLEAYSKLWFPVRWFGYFVLIVAFLIFGVYGGNFAETDFIYAAF